MLYLSATQNGIIRFDRNTDQKYVGLYTDNLQTCWAIIIFSKKNNRASLLHKTLKMDIESIFGEFTWVGIENLEWSIVSNNNKMFNTHYQEDLAKFLGNLRKKFPNISYPKEIKITEEINGAASINRKFEIALGSQEQTEFSPDKSKRYSINLINDWFLTPDEKDTLSGDLQHDGSIWTSLPRIQHQLSILPAKGFEDLGKAVKLDVTFFLADVVKDKGNEYYKTEEYDKALKCYERAIILNPNFAQAWYNKGMVLEKLKLLKGACKAWEKAIEIDPNYEKAKNKLNTHNQASIFSNNSLFGKALQKAMDPTCQKFAKQKSDKSITPAR